MAICAEHTHFFQEIFAIPDFLRDPILIMGVQDIFHGGPVIDEAFPVRPLKKYLESIGHKDVRTVDWQNPEADIKVNLAVPSPLPLRANTIIDIGTIEHVSNPHVVLQNYVSWLEVGGHLFIHTPVRGYFGHGLFAFSPEYIPATLRHNGFEIIHEKYSCISEEVTVSPCGYALQCSSEYPDVVTWVVGRKVREIEGGLQAIQQGIYGEPA